MTTAATDRGTPIDAYAVALDETSPYNIDAADGTCHRADRRGVRFRPQPADTLLRNDPQLLPRLPLHQHRFFARD